MGKPSSRQESSMKADRKYEKKVKFYAKIGEAITVLNAQKTITKKKKPRSRQKKLRAYDLSTLSEFLPQLKVKQQRPIADLKVNCKSRQKLILKEGQQMSTVLNHPAFHSDPLAAIHQHLLSTQPVKDEKPKKKINKNGSKKKKEKKSKALSGSGLMEMC